MPQGFHTSNSENGTQTYPKNSVQSALSNLIIILGQFFSASIFPLPFNASSLQQAHKRCILYLATQHIKFPSSSYHCTAASHVAENDQPGHGKTVLHNFHFHLFPKPFYYYSNETVVRLFSCGKQTFFLQIRNTPDICRANTPDLKTVDWKGVSITSGREQNDFLKIQLRFILIQKTMKLLQKLHALL